MVVVVCSVEGVTAVVDPVEVVEAAVVVCPAIVVVTGAVD